MNIFSHKPRRTQNSRLWDSAPSADSSLEARREWVIDALSSTSIRPGSDMSTEYGRLIGFATELYQQYAPDKVPEDSAIKVSVDQSIGEGIVMNRWRNTVKTLCQSDDRALIAKFCNYFIKPIIRHKIMEALDIPYARIDHADAPGGMAGLSGFFRH